MTGASQTGPDSEEGPGKLSTACKSGFGKLLRTLEAPDLRGFSVSCSVFLPKNHFCGIIQKVFFLREISSSAFLCKTGVFSILTCFLTIPSSSSSDELLISKTFVLFNFVSSSRTFRVFIEEDRPRSTSILFCFLSFVLFLNSGIYSLPSETKSSSEDDSEDDSSGLWDGSASFRAIEILISTNFLINYIRVFQKVLLEQHRRECSKELQIFLIRQR